EVGNEFVAPTLKEIRKELRLLREMEASTEELQMLRNYLMGTLLNALDGPFNASELVRALVLEGLPLSYFQLLIDTILTITPKQLQGLAQQYLREEDFWQVVVGAEM
ncbi:MAG: insulinase family protein, partial [Bacteroidota bacterium]